MRVNCSSWLAALARTVFYRFSTIVHLILGAPSRKKSTVRTRPPSNTFRGVHANFLEQIFLAALSLDNAQMARSRAGGAEAELEQWNAVSFEDEKTQAILITTYS